MNGIDVVFTGLDNIGQPFNRSGRTIKRWILHERFPAARLPNNEWVTTLPLISEWVLARARKPDSSEGAGN